MSSNPTMMRRPAAPPIVRPRSRVSTGVMLAVALGYIMLLPPQFNMSFGSSVVPPYRFFLLGSSLFIIGTFVRQQWRFLLPDYLMVIAIFWIGTSLYINSDFIGFFTSTVAQTSDVALSYFFARAAFRSLRDFRLFLLMMAPGLAAIAALLMVESVTKTHILQPLAGALLGRGGGYVFVDMRQGLMRAAGPFPHPILAGIFMASLLGLYWTSGLRRWPRWLGVGAAIGSFFTVSSAGLLGLVLGGALLAYNWLSERIRNLTWRLFLSLGAIAFFAVELGTQSGTFNLLVRFASFNMVSSYQRTLIWKYGVMNVDERPWFGIGYGEWDRPFWMPRSIDNYWLLQAIQFGIVPPLIFGIVMVLGVIALSRRSVLVGVLDQRTLRGIAIATAIMSLSTISVSVWLSAQVWFHMLMGISVSMGYGLATALPRRPARAMQPTVRQPAAMIAPHKAPAPPKKRDTDRRGHA